MDRLVQPSTDARTPVPVWDWSVRVVHWAMVVLVVALIATGLLGADMLDWHMRFGQTLLALVLFRILWGFVGSRNARFSAFLRGPAHAASYVRSLVRPPYQEHAGHTPLGGWMVVALLAALLFQAGTGLFTNDDILAEGPLVKHVSKDLSDAISRLHRRGWWIVAALSAVHTIAVFAFLLVLKHNLIAPMFTGRKVLPRALVAEGGTASSTRAIVLLVACAALVWWVVKRL